jgi:hypothetical protein
LSIYYDIIENVAEDVNNVLIPYGVPVEIRRRNVYLNGDSLPICIISPEDEEQLADMDFDHGTTWVYPINVALIYPDNRENNLALDAQLYLDIRQSIRDRLFYPLLNYVPEVWDVDLEGTKPFTTVDQKSTYSTTIWVVKYKAKETRRSS